MANTKISALSDGGNAQATDEFAVARSGANYRIDGASIAAAATSVGTLSSLTVSGNTYVATTSGALGVGTTSPSAAGSNYGAIDVRGTAGGGIRYGISAGFNMLTYATGTSADFVTSAAGDIRFFNKSPFSEALRITSTGDLIVGNGDTNGSPSPQTIRGTNGLGTDIAGAALTIQGGRGTGSGAGGAIIFNTSAAGASGTTLRTATERMRIDSAGNLGLGVTPSYRLDVGSTARFNSTLSVGNAAPAASGAGITFPATQSASSDANTLDDYEEGTFTSTAVGGTSAGTTTYVGTQYGFYTKIGRQVTVTGIVEWSAMTGTGNLKIGGFPFTIGTSDFYPVGNAITALINWTGTTAPSSMLGYTNTTYALLCSLNDDADVTVQVCANESGYVRYTLTYQV